jgi:hypothetical protein
MTTATAAQDKKYRRSQIVTTSRKHNKERAKREGCK